MSSSRKSFRPRENPGLLHCRGILYSMSHQGSPRILEGGLPFSRDLLDSGIKPGSHTLQVDFLPAELPGKHICLGYDILNIKKVLF